MKFSDRRPVKIVMLGAGGTGGHAAPQIYRMLSVLNQSGRKCRFILVDGDIVEPKNLIRQNFTPADCGLNKARVLAERYAGAFGMECEYIPEYIEDAQQLTELLTPEEFWLANDDPYYAYQGRDAYELVILLGCVDNNKSRMLCDEVFQKVSPLIYIDSGNGEFTGQVVCGIRTAGKTIYPPISMLYPDVLEDTDKFPTELSCEEASVSAPQSIAANVMAASILTSFVYNIVFTGENRVRSVHFSTGSVHVKPEITPRKRSKQKAVQPDITEEAA